MIKFIGKTTKHSTEYKQSSLVEFLQWEAKQKCWQLDVETNMADSVLDRKLRCVQFGEFDSTKEDKVQWVFDWVQLASEEKIQLLKVLNQKHKKKYIHNVSFEYQTLLNYGLVLENCYDTYLVEKILYTGYPEPQVIKGVPSFYSLAGVVSRRLGLNLDKTYQTLFTLNEYLTEGHILYAAQDVQHLDIIADQQQKRIDANKLQKIVDLENEACLAFSDIEYNGMLVDRPAWLANLELVEPIIAKYFKELEDTTKEDAQLYSKAVELGYINTKEIVEINWNSPAQKIELFKLIFPDIPGATKAILKKYMNAPNRTPQEIEILYHILELQDYDKLYESLLTGHRDYLIEKGYTVPAGSFRINWNSTDQVLALLKGVDKKLKSCSADDLAKLPHSIVDSLQNYKSALKLKTSYGQKFINEQIHSDGKVRTRFNQILNTGRVSSSKPNMQQIPANDDVGNRYRNCFIPDTADFVFVDSDYSSQELCVIASLSNDPVWISALQLGQDLHSVCAELVYGAEWKKAAQPDCAYYHEEQKQKCNCKGHKKMRTGVKTINFGLAYGMSQFKLAGTLKISVKEAELLIEKYFKTFPAIGSRLTALGNYGVKNGHILTLAPFFRRRWFPEWARYKDDVEAHLQNIVHNKALGGIERASKNTPIQGSSADMMKLALVYTRRYINENKLRKSIKLSMQVHDQLTTQCHKDKAEWWKIELTRLMEEAAKVIIPSGLLKAETNISERWSK